jgi:hypothetical protein
MDGLTENSEKLRSEILVILLSLPVAVAAAHTLGGARQSALPDLFLFTLKTTENSKGGYSLIRSVNRRDRTTQPLQ